LKVFASQYISQCCISFRGYVASNESCKHNH